METLQIAYIIEELSEMSSNELAEVAILLTHFAQNPTILDDGVHACVNRRSGFIFLSDSDYNVALMNQGKLERFYTCPNCGEEGFKEDFNEFTNDCCIEYNKYL